MKTKQNQTLAVVIMLAATLAISSCQKEKLTPKVTNPENVVRANETFYDIQRTILADVTANLSFKTENCETVTEDSSGNLYVRTIDYGTGCVDEEGKTRKGRVVITYTPGDFKTLTGANSYTTFEDFYIDDNQIFGSFNIHNNGINGNGNYTYTTIGKLDKVYANNQGTEAIEGQQEIEWISGANTPDPSDNEYAHTGSITGTGRGGEAMSLTILQPLIEKRAPGCDFMVSGQELIQVAGESDLHVDYGNGTCDNLAVETVDGNSQTVTLQ